jgi:hypothetical protein
MKSIRISERHSHLVFGVIQSAITCAVAAGIASIPFMETGSFALLGESMGYFLGLHASCCHPRRSFHSSVRRSLRS